jgi:hypothetical protein
MVGVMASYLVEAYTPAQAGLAEIEQRARDAASQLSQAGTAVRYVRSLYVPEDEICFHLFDAPSFDAVRQASDVARLDAQRIVEAVDGESGG